MFHSIWYIIRDSRVEEPFFRAIKPPTQEQPMSKGMDSKKQTKKPPAKTMKEKRAAKKSKKDSRGSLKT